MCENPKIQTGLSDSNHVTEILKAIWEMVLEDTIPGDVWEEIWRRVHRYTFCAKHSCIQCRILYRAHYTKAWLAKVFETVSHSYDRCQQTPANYCTCICFGTVPL